MTGSPYSPWKIFHHPNRIEALRSRSRHVLAFVQLIPTNACQHACNFCAYRTHGYSSAETFDMHDRIPPEKLFQIIDDCSRLGVGAIELTGGGEPTIYSHFVDACKRMQSHGIEYAVVTNGANLCVAKLEQLAHAKWVRCSVDAGTAETYSTIRRAAADQFFRTRYNIREVVARKDTESGDPIVGVGFVVTRDNWREVLLAAQNAKEDGADNFRISALFQNDNAGYFNEFYEEARELCCRASELESDGFRVFNLFGDRMRDLAQQFPDEPFCGYQHLVTYIGADQNIYRCCCTAYNQRGLLGSIREHSLHDLWTSHELQRKLDDFDARQCPRCMFNNKNKVIAYALDPDPLHVNFL